MNNVGVYGKVNLSLTDLQTGDVSSETVFNFITNYGLGRFFGPIEPGQFPANRLYFGTRADTPTITDDAVPDHWRYVPITTVTNRKADQPLITNNEDNLTYLTDFEGIRTFGNGETTEEYLITHGCLAYVGADGIPHALTHFRYRPDHIPDKIKHHEVNVTYTVVFSYPTMATNDGVSKLKVLAARENPSIPLNALYEPFAYRPKGVLEEKTDTYVTAGLGEFDPTSKIWTQKYNLEVRLASAATSQKFWCGPVMFQMTFGTPGMYELSIDVTRVDPDVDATPVTAVSKWNQSYLAIEAAPHQWVNVRTKDVPPKVVKSTYIGLTGKGRVDGFNSLFNRGKVYEFETIAQNGTRAYVDLITPDEYAEPLIAFYRIGPSKFRCVGNFGDEVEIQITPAFLRWGANWTPTGIKGRCETPSTDEPGAYYCDIDVPPETIDHEHAQEIGYTNTDLAGNKYVVQSYEHNRTAIDLYVPGKTYTWYKSGQTSNYNGEVKDGPWNQNGNADMSGFNSEIISFKVEIV